MKLNDIYKPSDCCDLADVKAGIERLSTISTDLNKKPVVKRILKYQDVVDSLNVEFDCYMYFIKNFAKK